MERLQSLGRVMQRIGSGLTFLRDVHESIYVGLEGDMRVMVVDNMTRQARTKGIDLSDRPSLWCLPEPIREEAQRRIRRALVEYKGEQND